MRRDKIILVDCDGVMLDWEFAFENWMAKHGYDVVSKNEYKVDLKYGLSKPDKRRLVRMFNESAQIRKLPPLRDAIKYIKKLHSDHGYVFHCISSLSTDEYAQHLRTKNLREMFGDSVFDKFVYLDTGADKDDALIEYKDTDCYWVEDKPANADLGLEMGLDSILVAHAHNSSYDGDALRLANWKEIYQTITG